MRIIFFVLLTIYSVSLHAEICSPQVNTQLAQYIVGYGSLMQTKSRKTTYPDAGENIPVIIKGYQRGWFAHGSSVGFSSALLGIKESKDKKFNGVIFKVASAAGMAKYDKREKSYCRVAVLSKDIEMLNNQPVPKGQFWVYVPKTTLLAEPSAKYPIVQSYVDTFLSGCLEMGKKYGLKTFASDCIDLTSGWSKHWINDRMFPRRPLKHQPDALRIDKLLSSKLKTIFDQIKIE